MSSAEILPGMQSVKTSWRFAFNVHIMATTGPRGSEVNFVLIMIVIIISSRSSSSRSSILLLLLQLLSLLLLLLLLLSLQLYTRI